MQWHRACLSVSVCPSLTVRSAIEIDERIELVFWLKHCPKLGFTSRSCYQQNSPTVELVDHTYDGRRVDTYSLLHVG